MPLMSIKPFFPSLLKFMSSSPVIVMALQAPGVVAIVREMMGATFSSDAAAGTIRGDLGCAQGTCNLVHGSDSDACRRT